jgi:hypothetical protein
MAEEQSDVVTKNGVTKKRYLQSSLNSPEVSSDEQEMSVLTSDNELTPKNKGIHKQGSRTLTSQIV